MRYLLGLLLCVAVAVAVQQEQREFVLKPPYTNAPEITAKDGVPKGTLHEFIMKSADSKIYPGISRTPADPPTPYERPVAVYVPAQYKPETAAPFIVIQDGASAKYRAIVPPTLDTLIAHKRITVMIAVL